MRDILKGNVSLGCVLGGSETPSIRSECAEDKSETGKNRFVTPERNVLKLMLCFICYKFSKYLLFFHGLSKIFQLLPVDVEEPPTEPESMPPPSQLSVPAQPSAAVQPAPPPADLETLNLFKDFSLCVKKEAPVPSSRRKKKQEDTLSVKSQDFFDPLSSALSEEDIRDDLDAFLRK